jgi:hypothetical protein
MVESFHWWPVAALAGADDAFMPRRIAEILGRYPAESGGRPEEDVALPDWVRVQQLSSPRAAALSVTRPGPDRAKS